MEKLTLNVEVENLEEEKQKVKELIQLLKEAKSLADDLATELELKIKSKSQSNYRKDI